jgi:transposase
VKKGRRGWRRQQPKLDPARLVFIDESGAKTNMTRLRGRAPRGERLHASAPCGRWESTTMISSVRLDGSTACMTIEGATNTEVFRAYVKEILLPTLRVGDMVVMDNLGAHKNAETIALIESAGAEAVFLPPYSPDLNPIEMMWSKVKSILRKLEPRDTDSLLTAIGTALSKVTASDAIGWFGHCGYNFI